MWLFSYQNTSGGYTFLVLFPLHVESISWCLLWTYLFLCLNSYLRHLSGAVPFPDVLPPGSLTFGKDTDIYGASPFAWRPCLRGWLSHQIPRVLYRSTPQPVSPLLLPLQAPVLGSRWGGRNAPSWRVRSRAEHHRAWELVSAASSRAFQQLSAGLLTWWLSSPSLCRETGGMCDTARPVGGLNASFFKQQFCLYSLSLY